MTSTTIKRFALAAVATFALAAPQSTAQCFGDDNLNLGGCCDLTDLVLPNFQGVQMPGLGVCWEKCDVADQNQIRVEWGQLQPTVCGQFVTPLRVNDAATGIAIMEGEMILDYSRTWLEFDPAGNTHQVWRFVARADMRAVTAPFLPVCPVPTILQTVDNSSAFFYGYLDYVDCTPTPIGTPPRNALVLYHACDRFIHSPGLSSQPGSFDERSFAIVAPHSAAQPFVPQNLFAPGGPVIEGAVRNVSTSPFACFTEDRVNNGTMDALAAGCVCTLQTNPKQQTLRDFRGVTNCPSPVGTPNSWDSQAIGFPTPLPWFEMVTTSIGCWENDDTYPGAECAWVDEGLFVHQDACFGTFVEIKYGGTTAKGWDAVSFTGTGLGSFTDLVDNWSAPLFGPYNFPIVGNIQPSDRVMHINLP